MQSVQTDVSGAAAGTGVVIYCFLLCDIFSL